jgi:general secretion pathway protein A
MYKSFYNLDSRPFRTQPDPSFLWLGEKHKEALTVLRYGILENKGFLLLTGEAGIGKTTLVNVLTESVAGEVVSAAVSDPSLERLDFYNAIAKGFKIDRTFSSKVEFLIQFSSFLHKTHDENKKVLLLVDDCHRLSQDMLEELRLLSNIEEEDARLINFLFVGRPEFNDMLVQPANSAVRQRLSLKFELAPLTEIETADYIRHRLTIAGSEAELFTARAMQVVHRHAGGNPRLVNIICDHAMVAGSVQGKRTLDHKVVEGCLQRLNLPAHPSPKDFAELADEKSHMHHFHGRFTPESSAAASTFTGFNLESDRRWEWLKHTLGFILVAAAGYYLLLPAEKSGETVRLNSGAVAVQQPTHAMMPAVPDESGSAVDDPARENATGQPAILEISLRPEPQPTPAVAAAPETSRAASLAPMEPARVILGLRPNSLELTGEAAGEYRSFVEKLKNYPQARLLVKGFVSAKTNSAENIRLSEERAMGVRKLLVASGIDPARIEVQGLGNQEPIASNDTSAGRTKNRRVEVVVVSDGR